MTNPQMTGILFDSPDSGGFWNSGLPPSASPLATDHFPRPPASSISGHPCDKSTFRGGPFDSPGGGGGYGFL